MNMVIGSVCHTHGPTTTTTALTYNVNIQSIPLIPVPSFSGRHSHRPTGQLNAIQLTVLSVLACGLIVLRFIMTILCVTDVDMHKDTSGRCRKHLHSFIYSLFESDHEDL